MTGFFEDTTATAEPIPHELNTHIDVSINGPVDGEVLTWSGQQSLWVNDVGVTPTYALDDLTDVNAAVPTDGQALVWSNASSEWVPATISTEQQSINLNDILDVTITGTPGNGDRLEYEAGLWVNKTQGQAQANPITIGTGANDSDAGLILNAGNAVTGEDVAYIAFQAGSGEQYYFGSLNNGGTATLKMTHQGTDMVTFEPTLTTFHDKVAFLDTVGGIETFDTTVSSFAALLSLDISSTYNGPSVFTISSSDTGVSYDLVGNPTGILSWAGVDIADENGLIGGGTGEVNTAANVGGANGLFRDKTGVQLNFKTVVAGDNMTVVDNGDTLTLNSTATVTGNYVTLDTTQTIASVKTWTNFNTFESSLNSKDFLYILDRNGDENLYFTMDTLNVIGAPLLTITSPQVGSGIKLGHRKLDNTLVDLNLTNGTIQFNGISIADESGLILPTHSHVAGDLPVEVVYTNTAQTLSGVKRFSGGNTRFDNEVRVHNQSVASEYYTIDSVDLIGAQTLYMIPSNNGAGFSIQASSTGGTAYPLAGGATGQLNWAGVPIADTGGVILPNHTHDASDVISGTFSDARIPNLATSKITSGTFANARISSSSVTQHLGGYAQESDIAFGQVTGSNGAIKSGSRGVSSVTRTGTGTYTINFSSAAASTTAQSLNVTAISIFAVNAACNAVSASQWTVTVFNSAGTAADFDFNFQRIK